VGEFAKAFDATGNKWIDGAIAGSGDTARPIMVSRITGGDPMAATQFNHGRQAQELVEAGLMRNLDDVAARENWKAVINPPSLLESCTLDGHIYCVPVNIHAWQWLWLSNQAFADAGVPVPTNWDEFVAAGPALRDAGKVPLALGQQGWQIAGLFNNLLLALGGDKLYLTVYKDKDEAVAAGPDMAKVFKAADDARTLSQGSNIQDWNQATNMVITSAAGGQSMGDWAQGEFQVAGQTAGKEYSCLPGMGMPDTYITTGGDAFYFPLLSDPAKAAAQDELARVMLSPEAQVAFNLKKGSMPVRGDIDLSAANDCMKKGLEILKSGNVIQSTDQLISPDTTTQINDLMTQFFSTPDMTKEYAQARYAEIIAAAE
jgi:glucose/mannose transport system substrate-binding protein